MQIKLATSFLIFFFLIIAGLECKKKPTESDDNTPKHKQNIFLSVEDTSVTEITLNVAIPESVVQRTFVVKRDTQTILSALCYALDTTFTDTALLPNHNYTYKAYRLKNNIAIDSNTLQVTTLDTSKRDYVWTIDTLSYPGSLQTTMRDIWASSPTNVYVVGHNDQNRGQMYHYNGIEWSPVRLAATDGGTIVGPFDLSAIYGFAENDIWVVGEHIYTNHNPPPNFLDSSLIIHFDGSQWREILITRKRTLTTIWGYSSNDIWAGGLHGTLYHFTGNSWEPVSFHSRKYFISITGYASNDIYATVGEEVDFVQPRDSSKYLFYHYNGEEWNGLDSFYIYPGYPGDEFGFTKIWSPSESFFLSVSKAVYKKNGNTWNVFFDSHHPFYGISGTNERNIFTVGIHSQVFHFNGVDWKKFPQFSDYNSNCINVLCIENEVFIISTDGSCTFIYHGK
jgi:hypothetical protein